MSDAYRPDRILVVEDEPSLKRAMASKPRAAGFEVFEADDGASALELARALRPDLVLTDVDMPRMDGLGLFLALRSDATTAALPVVFVTGRPDEVRMPEGLAMGADDSAPTTCARSRRSSSTTPSSSRSRAPACA